MMIFARRPSRRMLMAGLVLAAPLIAGCSTGSADDAADGPRVVSSFYPLEFVAERVAGDRATVSNLTAPGVEPHDLELTVQQTAQLAGADVAFYERGLQPAVDEAVEQTGPDHVVDAAEAVDLDADDLHFWLDPTRLAEAADAFSDALAEADPDNAAAYRQNLAALVADLEQLDADFGAGLSECRIDTVVVSHDAFGYLADYGLDFHAINGLSPDAEPSPAHIAELHDLIDAEGITTVFGETLASKEMSESIATDLGLKTAVLDPVEGLSDDTADEDYLSLMRANLSALREANQCS